MTAFTSFTTSNIHDVSMDDLLNTMGSMTELTQMFEKMLVDLFEEAMKARVMNEKERWQALMLFMARIIAALEAFSTIGQSAEHGMAEKLAHEGGSGPAQA